MVPKSRSGYTTEAVLGVCGVSDCDQRVCVSSAHGSPLTAHRSGSVVSYRLTSLSLHLTLDETPSKLHILRWSFLRTLFEN